MLYLVVFSRMFVTYTFVICSIKLLTYLLTYLSMFYCVVVVYLGQFLCTVSFRWYVFCLLVVLARFQYLPSDWLERLLWGSLTVARDRLQKAQAKECVWFSCFFLLLFHCSVVWLCCSPALRDIHCTSMGDEISPPVSIVGSSPCTKPS